MKDTDRSSEKRIVAELDFGAKTAKRATFEAFEFTIVGPHQVEVVNASYGFEKADHTYRVSVETRAGVPVPAECSCPADVHREPDCKHKVALATVGGPPVLQAAMAFENTPTTLSGSSPENATTAAEKLQADGGATVSETQKDACANGDVHCDGPDGDPLPCFDCFEVSDR